jgi:hypothetical protein
MIEMHHGDEPSEDEVAHDPDVVPIRHGPKIGEQDQTETWVKAVTGASVVVSAFAVVVAGITLWYSLIAHIPKSSPFA